MKEMPIDEDNYNILDRLDHLEKKLSEHEQLIVESLRVMRDSLQVYAKGMAAVNEVLDTIHQGKRNEQ